MSGGCITHGRSMEQQQDPFNFKTHFLYFQAPISVSVSTFTFLCIKDVTMATVAFRQLMAASTGRQVARRMMHTTHAAHSEASNVSARALNMICFFRWRTVALTVIVTAAIDIASGQMRSDGAAAEAADVHTSFCTLAGPVDTPNTLLAAFSSYFDDHARSR